MYILYLCMINFLLIGTVGVLTIISWLLICDITELKKRITAQEKLLDECMHVTADLINRHNELAEIITQAMEDAKEDMELAELLQSNIIFNPNSIGQA